MELSNALNLLGVEENMIEDWYSGLKRINKNRYVTVDNDVLVELTQDKYMICSSDEKTFDLLSQYVFRTTDYALTHVHVTVNEKKKQTTKRFGLFRPLHLNNYKCS